MAVILLESLSSLARSQYSDFPKSQISLYPLHPAPTRGAFRGRHGRRGGDAVDADRARDGAWRGDGKNVWTCPYAGVKPAERSRSDGVNKAWSPGRARHKSNHRAGKPDCLLDLYARVRLFAQFAHGPRVQRASAFPAPSRFKRAEAIHSKPRTPCAARSRSRVGCSKLNSSSSGRDLPSPEGEGRLALSEASMTGWGEKCSRALFDYERPSPHSRRALHALSTLLQEGNWPAYLFARIASGVSGCASGWALANPGSAIAVSKMRFTVG